MRIQYECKTKRKGKAQTVDPGFLCKAPSGSLVTKTAMRKTETTVSDRHLGVPEQKGGES